MRIVVTGASGYLGSQLSNYLASKHDVFALVRNSSSVHRLDKERMNVKRANSRHELDEVLSSIKPDIVINTAALYGRKGELYSDLVEANINFPLQLFELAEKHGVTAFIHTGTSLPDNISAYALTKSTFPKLIKHKNFQQKFINIELEHFYGPGDDESKFISYVIKQCEIGSKIELTSGEQERDFIYIKDVLSAYEILLSSLDMFSAYESIPLGSGEVIQVKDVVKTICKLCNSATELKFGAIPMRENELMHSCADLTKIKNLGWVAKHSLYKGLTLTISKEIK